MLTDSVGPLEAAWLILNLAALLFAFTAWQDARRDRVDARLVNGPVRSLTADHNVRVPLFGMAVSALLTVAVIPALLRPGGIPLVMPDGFPNVSVIALMAVPFVILAATLSARRYAARLKGFSLEAVSSKQDRQFEALGAQVAEGISASHEAEKAANRTQERIAAQATRFDEMQEAAVKAAAKVATAGLVSDGELSATIEDTGEKVRDIHKRVVPKDGS